ncbi:sugar ABC transporter ATP-binding protein [Antiquaquibacter soli]|uniref:Sugar ABC transporter ATP-binding protein n=1 Tax=Antiquaquibacter soli TaxID=3064523 RepID=A0ABT9BJP4_9MICO|nr:sugar ABC transporter ATP-binding protein [Protaetiibacter sp. WY-16]MDO7880658.1 sugar ABC transporter ATP-binding protein [Protaetiibacter sp. WY-16]
MDSAMNSGALEVRDIEKRFSGVPVLRGVSVAVRPGEVVGLVGHNGAGKSTLLRIISGAHRQDAGQLLVGGEEQSFSSPADAHEAGIATVYQELSLLPNLTVAQNAFLGVELRKGGILDRARMRRETRELTESFGLDVDPDRKVRDYPVATRQLLEVAIATRRGARFLLLDEPTTSLEGAQVERFLGTVRELAAQGFGIVLVDHKLEELYAVASRIVALVDGRIRIDAAVSEVSRDDVIQAIAGHAMEHTPARERIAPPASDESAPALRAVGVRTRALRSVSLDARAGRVLGLYGLVGSGRTEFLRTLIGLDPVLDGSIELGGAAFRPRTPAHAAAQGIVYVTEERKTDGIVPLLDAGANVTLPVVGRFTRAGFLQRARLRQEAVERMDQLSVLGDRLGPVVRLSGGNQQKVLLARALAQKPRILLLDEPTKGVDLGVKAQIHRMIVSLAHDEGLTVIVVSSEEDEICEIADDIVIFAHGSTSPDVLDASDVTPNDLRTLAWSAA